jgi:hypothetical protein
MASFLSRLSGWFSNKSQNCNSSIDTLSRLPDDVLKLKSEDMGNTIGLAREKVTPSRSDQIASVTEIKATSDSGFEDEHNTLPRVTFAMSDDSASDATLTDIRGTACIRDFSSPPTSTHARVVWLCLTLR